MQKYIWELDLWFLFACDKPMRFLSLFQRRRASPSIHYDSIYLGGPHVCVCNPKVMNFERFVMRFGPPRIMRFHRPSSFFTTAAGDKGHAMGGIDHRPVYVSVLKKLSEKFRFPSFKCVHVLNHVHPSSTQTLLPPLLHSLPHQFLFQCMYGCPLFEKVL